MTMPAVSRRTMIATLVASAAAAALAPSALAFTPRGRGIAFSINVAKRKFGALLSPFSKTHNLLTVRELAGKFRHAHLVPTALGASKSLMLTSKQVNIKITPAGGWVLVDSTGRIVGVSTPQYRATDEGEGSGDSEGNTESGETQPDTETPPAPEPETDNGQSGDTGNTGDSNSDDTEDDSVMDDVLWGVGVAVGMAAAYATGAEYTLDGDDVAVMVTPDGFLFVAAASSSDDDSQFKAPPPGTPERADVWY